MLLIAKRRNLDEPDPDKVAEFKKLKKEGYYTDEKKKEREVKAREDAISKKLNTIEEDANKKVNEINHELSVKTWLIKRLVKLHNKYGDRFAPDYDFNNVIHYTHSNTLCFNWMDSSSYKQITKAEFDLFCDSLTESDLQRFKGLSFELKGVITYTGN